MVEEGRGRWKAVEGAVEVGEEGGEVVVEGGGVRERLVVVMTGIGESVEREKERGEGVRVLILLVFVFFFLSFST